MFWRLVRDEWEGLNSIPLLDLSSQFFVNLLHLFDRGLILKGGKITDAGTGSDRSEDSPHNLPASSFWKFRDKIDVFGSGDWPYQFPNQLFDLTL